MCDYTHETMLIIKNIIIKTFDHVNHTNGLMVYTILVLGFRDSMLVFNDRSRILNYYHGHGYYNN